MTATLLKRSKASRDQFELTPAGHQTALECDYSAFVSMLETEAGTTDVTPVLSCPEYAVAASDFGASMPPVVSQLCHTENDTHHHRFLLHLLPQQTCFEGHFPGQPILAGIIQLHWAVRLAQNMLNCSDTPREILRLKYHNIAVPPRFVELQLETRGSSRVQFRVIGHDCMHAQGSLVFGGGA